MDRLREWSRPFLRELPHGTAYLGLMMVVIIWLGVGFHLFKLKAQLLESVRLNSANLARAFEEDVVLPLEPKVLSAVKGLDHAAELIAKARRECE